MKTPAELVRTTWLSGRKPKSNKARRVRDAPTDSHFSSIADTASKTRARPWWGDRAATSTRSVDRHDSSMQSGISGDHSAVTPHGERRPNDCPGDTHHEGQMMDSQRRVMAHRVARAGVDSGERPQQIATVIVGLVPGAATRIGASAQVHDLTASQRSSQLAGRDTSRGGLRCRERAGLFPGQSLKSVVQGTRLSGIREP